MMTSHTAEQLQAAIDAHRSVDAYDIAREFEEQKIDHCGHWVGVRLDPASGEWHSVCDASYNVTCDEYFQESGVLSNRTVCSGRCNETPGPADGYEWDEDDNGTYWGNDGLWCTEDGLEEFLEEKFSEEYEAADEGADLEVIAKSVGLYKFSVSTTPVDPDYSDLEKTIQEQIDELIEMIEAENG